MSEVTVTADDLFARTCTHPMHYRCRSYTFTFDTPDNPAAGAWTIVAAGVDDCAAYLKAHAFLFADCIDEGEIVRMTAQEIGEPGQTALYAWNDSRTCTFDVETP
jgi:hypothetical protein